MTELYKGPLGGRRFGNPPKQLNYHPIALREVMYYLYLPVRMRMATSGLRLPENLRQVLPLLYTADRAVTDLQRDYAYTYVSARKGFATPDNPLNRPGWHCDGFGTDDLNFIWWKGPGTRFAVQDFHDISGDHSRSLLQFGAQVNIPECIWKPAPEHLYMIDPSVVHATPIIEAPGCMREYVKISYSNEKYNLENNSHNYLFDYAWELHSRESIRNDPHNAQRDYKK